MPPRGHRTSKLLEEMLDASLAAAQMVEKAWSHDSPAQSGPPRNGSIGVADAHHAFRNEMYDFAIQRRLQAVGDMAGHLFVKADRPFSQSAIELGHALNRLLRRFGAPDNFDKGDQVRRVERVANDTAVGMIRARRLNFAHRETR